MQLNCFQSSNILKPHHLATDPLREIILSNIQGLAGKPGQGGLEPPPKALIIELYSVRDSNPWSTEWKSVVLGQLDEPSIYFKELFKFVVFIYNKYRPEI